MRRVLLRCICGNTLAAEIAGLTVVRHRGREWAGFVVSIRCEKCGRVWRPEQRENNDVTSYRIAEPEAEPETAQSE